jgi:VanZ family protein
VSIAARGALRDFARPRVWVAFWAFGWVLAIVLSLIHPPPIDLDVPDSDKVGHLLAYATLSAWAANLFATRRAWWLAALALVALGIGMEFAQGAFTDDRLRDPFDALANTVGVMLGMTALRGRAQFVLQALDRRWFGQREQ